MQKISVIIPVYNAALTLEQTVASIKAQTYENWEIILVNDGSTDNSLQVCKELAEACEKIRVLDKANGGVVSAYRLGIENADGALVSFCDADDTYQADFLERAIKLLDDKKCDFVSFACTLTEGNESHIEKNAAPEGLYDKARIQKEILPHCLFNDFIPGEYYKVHVYRWNKVYTKELLLRFVDELDEKCFQIEDNVFAALAVIKADSFFIENTSVYNYVIRPQSITTGCSENLIDKYTYSLSVLKGLCDKYLAEYNPRQFTLLAWENYRIAFRKIAKGAGFKTAKAALKKIRESGYIADVKAGEIKLLKNYLFYYLYHLKLDFLLYLCFKVL